MPPVAAAAASVAAFLATPVVAGFTLGQVLMATYAVGSAIEGRRRAKAAAADARRKYLDSLQGRAVMVRSAVEPRKLVYGVDRVSGPIADMFTTGANGEYLHIIVALTGRRVHSIPIVYLNEFPITTASLDADGNVTSGQWLQTDSRTRSATVTTNGSGVATLPMAAASVQSASPVVGAEDGAANLLTGWSHVPGSSTVTGLPVSSQVNIAYSTSAGTPCVRIHVFTGAPGETIPTALLTETGGRRTTAHAGAGMAWLWVRLKWSQDVFGTLGVPNISAQVWGHLVRDPRTGSSAWSRNAALCAADFITDQELGLRCPAGTVPDAELIAEANICDEAVAIDAGGTNQLRYTVDGALSAGDGRLDNLEAIVDSMAGSAVWAQGRWRLYAGAYRTPEPLVITKDHLGAKPPQLQRRPSRRELINGVRARYRDATLNYAETTAPAVTNATYVTQDGGRSVIRDIPLPLVNDSIRAQRLAKIVLERARQATTISLQTSMRGYDLLPGQVVPVKLARYGWASGPFPDGKPMEVRRRSWNVREGVIDYVLRETAASVYAWNYGEATVIDDAPDTALPSPWGLPPALTGLAVTSSSDAANAWQQSDGTRVTSVRATWTASADPYVLQGGSIQVEWLDVATGRSYRLPPLAGDSTSAAIAPVPERRHIIVSVRAVNGTGQAGPWAQASLVVQPPARVPSAVAGLTATVQPAGVLVSWTANADLDHMETEVRVGASWAAGTVVFRGSARSFIWAWPAAGTYTLRARHRSFSRAESATDATAGVVVNDAMLIAAPQILPGSVTAVDMVQDPGPYTGTANDASVVMTPLVTCEAVVTVDMNFECTNSGGTAALIYGAFNVGYDDGTSYGAYGDRFVSQTLPAGQTIRFPVSISYRFASVPAGVAQTWSAVYSDHGSSVLTGVVSNLRTRVELIYR